MVGPVNSLAITGYREKPSVQAWVVCFTASLFFFYEFIQMNMYNAIGGQLMQSFHIDATGVSRLSSFYFIANVIFLFPAGMLLDRCSAKFIILFSLAICVLGTALFSMASGVGPAAFFRFLTGIGSAFCFLSVIRLATRWFSASRLALVIGLVVTVAMLGGVVAQKPLSLLVAAVSWRRALWFDAALGLVIFSLIFWLVKDYPENDKSHVNMERKQLSQQGYWKSLGLAFLKMHNWLGGIFACLMNLPIIILGGLWGVAYLVSAHSLTNSEAPNVTQMLFFGTIIGSPLVGWISDTIGLRRLPMMVGAIVSVVLLLTLILSPHLGEGALMVLFLILGVSTSAQILGYPIVAENSLPAITAMSVSVVNITSQAGLAIFEPVFGYLIDLHHRLEHVMGQAYSAGDFSWSIGLFPVAIVIAFFAALMLRETYGRLRGQE